MTNLQQKNPTTLKPTKYLVEFRCSKCNDAKYVEIEGDLNGTDLEKEKSRHISENKQEEGGGFSSCGYFRPVALWRRLGEAV